MSKEDDQSFLGRGWGFPPRFDVHTGRVSMVEREDDIQQSLRILFSTTPGERVMRPQYGCNLRLMVFENLTESITAELEAEIRHAVLFFEPRIDLKAVNVSIENELEGRMVINLDYVIRATNSRSNMVYPYYYLEGTHIPGVKAPDQPADQGHRA